MWLMLSPLLRFMLLMDGMLRNVLPETVLQTELLYVDEHGSYWQVFIHFSYLGD